MVDSSAPVVQDPGKKWMVFVVISAFPSSQNHTTVGRQKMKFLLLPGGMEQWRMFRCFHIFIDLICEETYLMIVFTGLQAGFPGRKQEYVADGKHKRLEVLGIGPPADLGLVVLPLFDVPADGGQIQKNTSP